MTRKRKSKPRVYVELTAYWADGAAESSIKVSRKRWREIQDGAEHDAFTWSYYEGQRFSVSWYFNDGYVSIGSEDGSECIVKEPIDVLYVTEPE